MFMVECSINGKVVMYPTQYVNDMIDAARNCRFEGKGFESEGNLKGLDYIKVTPIKDN